MFDAVRPHHKPWDARQRSRETFPEQRFDVTLDDLTLLPIATDPETGHHAWGIIVHLAHRHGLTVCEACYLEPAHRRGLPLPTLDRELRAAATAEGIGLLRL